MVYFDFLVFPVSFDSSLFQYLLSESEGKIREIIFVMSAQK